MVYLSFSLSISLNIVPKESNFGKRIINSFWEQLKSGEVPEAKPLASFVTKLDTFASPGSNDNLPVESEIKVDLSYLLKKSVSKCKFTITEGGWNSDTEFIINNFTLNKQFQVPAKNNHDREIYVFEIRVVLGNLRLIRLSPKADSKWDIALTENGRNVYTCDIPHPVPRYAANGDRLNVTMILY